MFASSTTDSVAFRGTACLRHHMHSSPSLSLEAYIHTGTRQYIKTHSYWHPQHLFIMISNNITLIGNLGSDIKVNEFASDKRVGKVGLAYSSMYTNKKGEREEKTDWFNLTIWNKTCERMAAQVGKGSRVLIEGRLTTNSYENKEGQQIKTVEIIVNSFQKIERPEKVVSAPVDTTEEALAF